MFMGRNLGKTVLALGLALAPTAQSQTVVFQETWQGAAGPFPQVINPGGGFIATGQSFQADNLWTAEPNVTDGIDVGPHLAISLVDIAGDRKLEWNANGADGADNDVAFEAPIASPFKLEDVVSVTMTATVEVRAVGTNGGRDSTFYFGADFENYFAMQLVTRNSAGVEVVEVEWAQGGIDDDTTFGDGAVVVGGGAIVAGGAYRLEAKFTPGTTEVALEVTLTDTATNNVILNGTHNILRADAPDYATLFDFFMIEGKRRMYHTWRDIQLSIEMPDTTPPVITRNGAASVSVNCGATYLDAGATANDNVDGNITSSIVTVNPVNTNIPGVYTVTYNVSDAAGNPAAEVTRTVTVQNNCPSIIVQANTATSASRQEGESVTFGVTAIGAGPFTYEWFFDNGAKSPVSLGVATPSITISPIVFADEGEYYCNVSDGITTVASPTFTLDVTPPLPAASLMTLLAATMATALGGTAALRRKR